MSNFVVNEKSAKVKNPKKTSGNSTQLHLRISEIKNDTVILKNGGVRAVLKSTSINFNLKSEDEQTAIIRSYQSFLNTLDFPIQIIVKSKKLDLDNYLAELSIVAEKQTNPLLQKQTFEYVEYVKRLLEYADIMNKEFMIVVPYNGVLGDEKPSGFISFFNKFLQRLKLKEADSTFAKHKKEFENLKKGLDHRVNTVTAGLENCGLTITRLTTSDLIELYYESYNPEIARLQKIKNLADSDLQI